MSRVTYHLSAYVNGELIYAEIFDDTAELQNVGLEEAESAVESELTFNQDLDDIRANNRRFEKIQEGEDE